MTRSRVGVSQHCGVPVGYTQDRNQACTFVAVTSYEERALRTVDLPTSRCQSGEAQPTSTPPAAAARTTIHGGRRQNISRLNTQIARPKSARPRIALFHTGS